MNYRVSGASLMPSSDICELNLNGNTVIQGDNAVVLKRYMEQLEGKVDVIVTDPPYNVSLKGSYNDTFTDDEWEQFIEQRFSLAYQTLKDGAVCFVHIADKTYAQLRMILDGIFGKKCYLGTIIQDKCNAQNDAHNIQVNHDFICVYGKNVSSKTDILYTIEQKKVKLEHDEYGYWYKGAGIVTGGEGGILERRQNLGYSIYVSPSGECHAVDDYDKDKVIGSDDECVVYYDDYELDEPIDGCTTTRQLVEKGYRRIRPPRKGAKLGCWTWGIDTFNSRSHEIMATDGGAIAKKMYVDDTSVIHEDGNDYFVKETKQASRSIISFPSANGTKQLESVAGEKRMFLNPKNVDMESYLISLYHRTDGSSDNLLVMDFFAGSGTTGQAAFACGDRFILITNNEVEPVKIKAFFKQHGVNGKKQQEQWKLEHGDEWNEFVDANGNCSYVLRKRLDNIGGLAYKYVVCD